jgi:hypothetical protein
MLNKYLYHTVHCTPGGAKAFEEGHIDLDTPFWRGGNAARFWALLPEKAPFAPGEWAPSVASVLDVIPILTCLFPLSALCTWNPTTRSL